MPLLVSSSANADHPRLTSACAGTRHGWFAFANHDTEGGIAFGRVALLLALSSITLMGCSTHEIDTFQEYCEGIVGIDLQKKYEPFWSGVFSVSYKADAIRDDYADFLNKMYLKEVTGLTKRMVWRRHAILHLTNPSSFFEMDRKEFIQEWRSGIAHSLRGELKNDADRCLFSTAAELFDQIDIHTLTSKNRLFLDTDTVTTITTDRKKHFKWVPG